MTKQEAIAKLVELKTDIALQDKFSGQAKLVKNIRKRINFLKLYADNNSLSELFVRESEREIANIPSPDS